MLILVAAIVIAQLTLVGCEPPQDPQHQFDAATIDAGAQRLMEHEDVQGLALAIIENDRVAHIAAYGRRNVERDLPADHRHHHVRRLVNQDRVRLHGATNRRRRTVEPGCLGRRTAATSPARVR